jgi:thiamine-phosphate pyrophosphorylase
MSKMIFPSSGLYAVTAENHVSPEALAVAVGAALRGGARVVQYRAKSAANQIEVARLVLDECRAAGVPLIVNDDVDLALAIGADGVHLGKDDGPLTQARARLGAEAIIGVSCYDALELAVKAQAQGASYVAFGRFFPSKSKPNAPCAHLETLLEAKRKITIPIVAIGGITPDNGRALIEAGADVLAVIDGVFGTEDPEQAARSFLPLFF